ncbi:hypothetical protein KFE25_002021 [Diacronema lutheri]|uniref:Uncharacterized protein n=2 Tax=Diacronema lutheri TaxID=2081491 RepID=A0A8J6CDV6_DIALT|nr:hypothetical protein KFE25_002021 [Diacronema lutheri]
MSAMQPNSTSHELLAIVLASTEANCKILVMVVLGVVATFKGIFDSKGISDLGRLVYHITLPALLFSKILKEFSLERVHVVYWLPVFCVLHAVIAFFISRLLGCLLGISPFELRVVMGSLMFGNVGALAIAVVSTLCTSEPLLSEVGPTCEARAVSYIAWYLIAQNVIMFSWGEALLFAKPAEEPASVLVRGPSGTAVDRAADTNDDGGDDAERGGGGSKGVGGGVRADRLSDALLGSSAAPASAAIAMDGGGRGEESALESAGGTPRFCHSAASSAPSGMAAGGGGLLDASISTDSLADGAASVWSGVGAGGNAAGAQLRRQRFRTAAVRARPGDDSVLIRRSDSFAYSQRRLSRSASTLLAGMSEAAVARTAADDEGFARELRDDELVPPTLSYMEIQQAASRVGLEVMAFHPLHHASTALLASSATAMSLDGAAVGAGAGGKAEPLLQNERNQFSVVVRPGALLHGALSLFAMRAYSVAAGVLKNPPIQAAVLAVALSAYPPVKAMLVGPDAPLRFATSAVESLGAAQVPISMLMLSGSGTINYMKNLKSRLEAAGAELPPFAFSLGTEFAIILGRLVLLPLAGFLLYTLLAGYLQLLPKDDPLLLLVILIESAVPSAQNLIMMLLVHGDIVEGEAMASVLLRQYAVSMVTFTIAAACFQTLVFGL